MKRSIIVLMFVSVVLCTGCDAFRRLAGRPTSVEIEARKAAIEAAMEAEHQARIDSLRRVEKQMADSLAVLDSLKQMNGTMLEPAAMGGLFTTRLDRRYYVIVGSFMDKGNADYLKKEVEGRGYPVTLINFRNGYTAVGACPSDSIVEAYESLRKIQGEPFSPDDVWILVN